MAVIEIKDLVYTYPSVSTPALSHLNLVIEEGQFVALVGANGAGKSTLCYALAGFVPHFFRGAMTGSILLDGVDTQKASLAELVLIAGLTFQNPFNQISGTKFTVYEEIAFGLENIGVPREEMIARIEKVMESTGITHLAERSPYALSGGQQQRVALASILVMQPKVLVLDEPTSQLDPIGTREVFQVIKDLSLQGMTIVMAEHKVEWIAEFADRVVALDSGSIVASGTPGEVLSDLGLQDKGIALSRYTLAAAWAVEKGWLPPAADLPINLTQAVKAFSKVIEKRVR